MTLLNRDGRPRGAPRRQRDQVLSSRWAAIENRVRFGLEVATAVASEIGAQRTGFRISPSAPLAGWSKGTRPEISIAISSPRVDKLKLTYRHLMHTGDENLAHDIRARRSNLPLFLQSGRTLDAGRRLEMGAANPDFVERYRKRAPLNEADPATFYSSWLARRHQFAKSHGKRQPTQTASVLDPAMQALASMVLCLVQISERDLPGNLTVISMSALDRSRRFGVDQLFSGLL